MRRPTIKTSMIAIFAVMALIMGLSAGSSLFSLGKVHGANEALSGRWMPSMQAARDIEVAMANTRVAYAGHLSASTALEKSTAEEQIRKAQDNFRAAIDAYKPWAGTERENQLVGLIEKAYGQYTTFGANMVELSNANDIVMASSVFSRNMKMVAGIAVNSIGELVKINVAGSAQAIASAQTTYDLASKMAIGLLAAVLVLALAAMIYTLRGITLPIGRLTGVMGELARGNLEASVPYAGRSDELGQMAGTVSVFRQALISTRTLEAEAEENRKAAEAARLAAQEQAERDAAERLARATAGLGEGLRRLARGDLSVELRDAFSPEFEQLRTDFNASVRQLADTLAAVIDGIGTIDASVREISRGTDDLSRRTEQQAASLEETAAALDEITVNVSTSANRTNEARGVAAEANATAVRSAEVVGGAVDAMRRIEEASRQIVNIIGVIDEIAFQTNLLALNAGVEAARAGDAGKGFAVVAQEVRELAQRSARAAKEIKELIGNSNTEVASGVRMVGETGAVLRQIEGFIVTINEHMEAIASSAREQSQGLGEVNAAVNQMDQVTQSNAAMVEETSPASLKLADEVAHLRQMIGRFQIADAAAGKPSDLAAMAARMAGNVPPARPAAAIKPAAPKTPVRKTSGRVAAAAAAPADDWQEF